MKCFLDFKSGGGLCHILATAYRFKQEQGWRRFDFPGGKVIFFIYSFVQIFFKLCDVAFYKKKILLQSGSRTDRTVDMLMAAERALIQNRCMTVPSVFVRPDVDKNTATKVKEMVRKHQGNVVENEADATHVIYPPVDPIEEEYARPCMRRERSVLLHWYYFPDSYDTWTTLDLPWDFPEGNLANTNSRYLTIFI